MLASGVYYRGMIFNRPLRISSIPEVESIVFEKQSLPKTDSHVVTDIKPHEIKVSAPPKKQYSTRYLVVFLGRKILGAVEDQKYKYTYYDINLPQNTSVGKSRKNDGLVPLGDYYVLKHELHNSVMYLTLNYPNSKDAAVALKNNLISKTDYDRIVSAGKSGTLPPFDTPLGGPVVIRGDGKPGMSTRGNIGIPSAAMQKIWEFAVKGTPVRILP